MAPCRADMRLADLIGDYQGFYRKQMRDLQAARIDIEGCDVSHLAVRVATYPEYLRVRDSLERHSLANVENIWNHRPISKLLLQTPLTLAADTDVSLVELIPPVHRTTSVIGLEHIGVVMGEGLDEFAATNKHQLSGQQYQGQHCEPYFITFSDGTSVKFYRNSLRYVCESEGQVFDGFYHADWPLPGD